MSPMRFGGDRERCVSLKLGHGAIVLDIRAITPQPKRRADQSHQVTRQNFSNKEPRCSVGPCFAARKRAKPRARCHLGPPRRTSRSEGIAVDMESAVWNRSN